MKVITNNGNACRNGRHMLSPRGRSGYRFVLRFISEIFRTGIIVLKTVMRYNSKVFRVHCFVQLMYRSHSFFRMTKRRAGPSHEKKIPAGEFPEADMTLEFYESLESCSIEGIILGDCADKNPDG